MPYKTYQEGGRRSTRGGAVKEETAKEDAAVEMKDVTNTEYTEENKEVKDEEEGEEEEGREVPEKKPWLQRTKEGGVKKIPKEVQKRRRNYRLKKMLTPKAPIMVLHELLGQTSVQYEVSDPVLPVMGQRMPALYNARTQYDGQMFTGMGPSKSIAKNICAEQVLQYITTKSCAGNKTEAEGEEEEEGDQENGGKISGRPDMETDTPWVSLASLALFKLFNDWQAQGYVMPPGIMRGNPNMGLPEAAVAAAVAAAGAGAGGAAGAVAKPKKPAAPKGDKVLPENPQDKHPVQLLNEMTGPLTYEQTGQTGTPPNCIFTMAVNISGTTYSGQGKSKKEAKKAAAIAAAAEVYNVQYPTA